MWVCAGRELIAQKAALGHGHFERWIEAEFEMSLRTAQSLMSVADRFSGKSATVALLPVRALYALAAPSTPEVVRDVVEVRWDGWDGSGRIILFYPNARAYARIRH